MSWQANIGKWSPILMPHHHAMYWRTGFCKADKQSSNHGSPGLQLDDGEQAVSAPGTPSGSVKWSTP